MNDHIQIRPLSRSPRDVLRFLKVSYGIYRNAPHWVAPLLLDAKQVFSPANPLFTHAEMELWIATHHGRGVGRIAGILDHNYPRAQRAGAAFFGFFECVHDPAVSQQLVGSVLDWARPQGLRRLLGPMNPTSNDECGLLVVLHHPRCLAFRSKDPRGRNLPWIGKERHHNPDVLR